MTVETIIQSQIDYAAAFAENASTFLSELEDIATSGYYSAQSNASIPLPTWDDSLQDTLALLLSLFPSDLTVSPITGTAPTFTPDVIDALPDQPVPDFGKTAPVLNIPTTPSTALPSAPVAPSISDPVLPTAPVLTFPVAPTIESITLPEPPSIEVPNFTSILPPDDLVVPSNNFQYFEELYSSALLDAQKAKLLSDLTNGGYGIEVADEQAMWERTRARELEAANAELDMVLQDGAARGFPMPPGDLNIAVSRARQKLHDKLSNLNREIFIKRADQFVDNRKFTIQEVRQLEQILIGYHNSVRERALNAAVKTLEASIQVYNAQVARAQYRLERYKSEASVFEARLRAALVQVQVYATTMEGKKVEVDLQRARVEVYNAQLAGLNSVVNLYRSQLDAAKVQSEIEQLRIQSFRALIEAYTAQIQAKVGEFNMYEASIRGEVAKVQAYESEVKAYTAAVEGARAKAEILIARLKAQIDVATNNVEVFKARMEAYRTDISAQAQTVDANVRVYGAKVQGATAKAGAITEAHRMEITQRDLEFRRNVEAARLAVDDARMFLDGLLKSAEIRMRSGEAASNYYKTLIGAAINSINTLTARLLQE